MYAPRLRVGDQIRKYRKARGNRSQRALAAVCGVTERYMSLIETNQKTPSPKLLSRIAAALGVPVALLLCEDGVPEPGVGEDGGLPEVARALRGGPASGGGPRAEPAELSARVGDAWEIWQTSRRRFTIVERVLPVLVRDVEQAVRECRGGSDPSRAREISRAASDLYGLLRSYFRRVGRMDLALLVADRALRSAQDADDPVRIATAQWNLGHVLLSDTRRDAPEEAKDVALAAIKDIGGERRTPELLALRGALELVAVVAEAQQQKWWKARRRLEKTAGPLSVRSGEGNVGRTVFGPTNVELHTMSIEMLAGETGEALRLADQVDISRLPSRERRFTFGLEVARCYDMRREDVSVYVHLLDLEELAPEDLARSAQARALVADLLRRVRPTYQRQVAALAGRLGVV
ncbi:helix-turn-helix transcriptional regulator [Streptomyces sp. JV176]|uniref:helix-turn-helix domain-containing protein n=1 Tax=Streptomyces sp. JV176 TaxID=858630 RepID=UPI002E79A25B|nr:helix-turn-helix transcriptional regulator [Streptomyces sp. JV176]MEE1798110.1 helix-turn-helix transcriptional regulator [Streptomyces sp. JV176]